MIFVGIDPSQRHTGICVFKSPNDYELMQITTKTGWDLQTSAREVRLGLRTLLSTIDLYDVGFGIERMIPGAATSPLMFAIQTIVWDEILNHYDWIEGDPPTLGFTPHVVTPYPVQLKAYMSKKHGVDIKNKKSGIIDGYRAVTGDESRVSSHRAEAYFLAYMAWDVGIGQWSFTQKRQRLRIFPWSD